MLPAHFPFRRARAAPLGAILWRSRSTSRTSGSQRQSPPRTQIRSPCSAAYSGSTRMCGPKRPINAIQRPSAPPRDGRAMPRHQGGRTGNQPPVAPHNGQGDAPAGNLLKKRGIFAAHPAIPLVNAPGKGYNNRVFQQNIRLAVKKEAVCPDHFQRAGVRWKPAWGAFRSAFGATGEEPAVRARYRAFERPGKLPRQFGWQRGILPSHDAWDGGIFFCRPRSFRSDKKEDVSC